MLPDREVTCSSAILGPFLRMVTACPEHKDLVPDAFWSATPGSRVSLAAARAMLRRGTERLRDERLGMKMGRSMHFGEGGAFDYAVRSAPTVREAVNVASRFSSVHSDPFRIQFETWRSYALIRLDDETWIGPSSEFAMSAFYRLHVASEVPSPSGLQCWFPYAAPSDTSEYERTFYGARLKFGAPFHAFAFDRSYEGAPMPHADPKLHGVHRARVETELATLREWHSTSSRVRRFIREELHNTRPATLVAAARALQMTQRTMVRRLEQEGSSFIGEQDGARFELGVASVAESDRSFKEIAFSLGFAHVESFHRAFKRWTGQTPSAYRKRARLVGSP